jgi:hypothetical protein
VDKTALMDVAERRCQVNGNVQETRQIERLLPLKNAVERLTARVGENKDCAPFVPCERQRFGRPRGLKLGCERVFVFEALQTPGRRLFGGGSDHQERRWVAALPGAIEREFRAIADSLQHVLRRCCHLRGLTLPTTGVEMSLDAARMSACATKEKHSL